MMKPRLSALIAAVMMAMACGSSQTSATAGDGGGANEPDGTAAEATSSGTTGDGGPDGIGGGADGTMMPFEAGKPNETGGAVGGASFDSSTASDSGTRPSSTPCAWTYAECGTTGDLLFLCPNGPDECVASNLPSGFGSCSLYDASVYCCDTAASTFQSCHPYPSALDAEGPDGQYPGCALNQLNAPECSPTATSGQTNSWYCELYDGGTDPQNGSPREFPSPAVSSHCSPAFQVLSSGGCPGGISSPCEEYCCSQ